MISISQVFHNVPPIVAILSFRCSPSIPPEVPDGGLPQGIRQIAHSGVILLLIHDVRAEAILSAAISMAFSLETGPGQEFQFIVAHGGGHRTVLLEPVFRRRHQVRRIGSLIPVSKGQVGEDLPGVPSPEF